MKWSCFFLLILFWQNVYCGNETDGKANKDTVIKRGVFVSLNFNGVGEDDAVAKKSYTYLTLSTECGWWLHDKIIAGGQVVTSFLFNNFGYDKGYQPFEANLFLKYYPFKKPLKWIGFQAQCGFGNSGMGKFDPKEKIFLNTALGFNVNFRFGKHKQWAFTYTQLFYALYGISYNGDLLLGEINNVPICIRSYFGFNYTFPRKKN